MAEWRAARVGEYVEFTRGISWTADQERRLPSASTKRVLRIPNVQRTLVLGDVLLVEFPGGVPDKWRAMPGSIVMVGSNGNPHRVGNAVQISSDDGDFLFASFLISARPLRADIDGRFLFHWWTSVETQDLIARSVQGSTGLGNLSLRFLEDLSMPLPPLKEQRRIAEVLDAFDEVINTTERVLAKRKVLRAALIREQVLPHGGLGAVSSLPAGWIDVRIGDALRQHVEPVRIDDHQTYDLISIRRRHGGMFHRESLHGSRILGKNMQRVVPGTFVIARRQIVHGACSVATPEFADSVMSMSYSAFVGSSICDPRYFFALAQTPPMISQFWNASHGVVIEKLNFQQEEWLDYRVQLPPIEVQRKVIAAVSACEADLTTVAKELEALRGTRSGLAADLLSGRTRVTP